MTNGGYRIDRCVCFEVTFEQLKRCADDEGLALDELQQRFGCGRGCGLCLPYIRRMLETGQTCFHEPLLDPTPPAV